MILCSVAIKSGSPYGDRQFHIAVIALLWNSSACTRLEWRRWQAWTAVVIAAEPGELCEKAWRLMMSSISCTFAVVSIFQIPCLSNLRQH